MLEKGTLESGCCWSSRSEILQLPVKGAQGNMRMKTGDRCLGSQLLCNARSLQSGDSSFGSGIDQGGGCDVLVS